ncbi:MAG: fadJ [Phycisphaerales bacterium]|nr:fadJ [Phycisphaerales bacterium]
MQTLRTSTDPDGVVTVLLDAPGKSLNTLIRLMFAELAEVVTRLEEEKAKAVIFASAKKRSFIAGADVFEISSMSPGDLERHLAFGQELFTRIEQLPMPTVAVINGDCLGGGLELALACTLRVSADEPSISLGLPEVKLGLVPGWGGTVRLPRLIGLAEALSLMTAGRTLSPAKALKAGLIDEVAKTDELLAAARRLVLSGAKRREVSSAAPSDLPGILENARAQTLAQTRGNYPAPLRLIEVVAEGWNHGRAAGMAAERKALVEMMGTDAAKGLIRVFFLRQGAKRAIASQIRAQPAEVKHAAVIGGGVMGAGIVHALIRAGINVRLIEINADAASAGISRVCKALEEDVAGGRMTASDAAGALGRITATSEWAGLEAADIVIEAAVERIEVKREIFAKLDRAVRPDCVLATNTSSLSVSEMAGATANPGWVVGLHFFNPVAKMPLVEVVRTGKSQEQALATAAGLAGKIGKTAVLVNDSPGFLVNRVLMPYLAEALVMAGEGADVRTVDEALKRWGMPMGPFELLDEIGLDVSSHILKSLAGHFGERLPGAASLDSAVQRGWLGKKSGRGFYVYGDKRGAEPQVNPEQIATPIAPRTNPLSAKENSEEIAWRLVLPMVNEAARLLEEGVVDNVDAVDLAMVLGTSFAPFRGGLVHFVDGVGVEVVVRRMKEMAEKHGSRFAPAPLLNALAAARLPLRDFGKMNRREIP